MPDLINRQCSNDITVAPKLGDAESLKWMSSINPDWQLDLSTGSIARQFEFKNYYQTMAFTNCVAWIAHQQNHHPDLTITFRHCMVTYTTHSVNGLSINDLICAARVDALISE